MKTLVAGSVCQTYTHNHKSRTRIYFEVEKAERMAIASHRRYCI